MKRKAALITLLVFCPFIFSGCDSAGKNDKAVLDNLNAKLQADADKAARDQAALQDLTKVRPTPPLAKPTGWEFKAK
jgi:hypothetical protein